MIILDIVLIFGGLF